MGGGLLIVEVVSCLAILMRSRKVAISAIAMLVLFTAFFPPWNCFAPFAPNAYNDPDVVSAADGFRMIGIWWVLTSVFVLASVIVAWRSAPRTSQKNALAA